jgi:hypothetical protein
MSEYLSDFFHVEVTATIACSKCDAVATAKGNTVDTAQRKLLTQIQRAGWHIAGGKPVCGKHPTPQSPRKR